MSQKMPQKSKVIDGTTTDFFDLGYIFLTDSESGLFGLSKCASAI